MESASVKEVHEVLGFFNVTKDQGLSARQVAEHAEKYGRNEFAPEETTPFWKLILEQFEDLLVHILLLAAIVSFILAIFEEGEERFTAFVEPVIICLILIANATVGVLQENRAEQAIEALKQYETTRAFVNRGGNYSAIDSKEIVPGDIVELHVGEKIPADVRMVELLSSAFIVDQALLTGESQGIRKDTKKVSVPNPVKQDMVNMLFAGSNVVRGTCRGVVTAVGDKSALGQIREQMQDTEQQQSPLKKKLDDFGNLLAKVIAVICIVVWLINIGHFSDPAFGGWVRGAVYYFKIAVALAVAAIPEGLPAVVTTCLALGTRRMAQKNAIVRTLPSVETLGCTTIICSDKTGTLTTNMMSVEKVLVLDRVEGNTPCMMELDVSGTSFAPIGDVSYNGSVLRSAALEYPTLGELGRVSALCNESHIEYNHKNSQYEKHGESTEAALKVLAEKLGVPDRQQDSKRATLSPAERASFCDAFWKVNFERLLQFEFTRDRKSMSVLVHPHDQARTFSLAVKGAPESILDRCTSVMSNKDRVTPLTPAIRAEFNKQLLKFGTGQNTLRCLALAVKPDAKAPEQYDCSDVKNFAVYEDGLVLVGIVGMLDPPRMEVAESIRVCRTAGLRVIVITGDNKQTAEAICRRIGIFASGEDLTNKSFTGREFDDLPRDRKFEVLKTASLFSRVEPEHKFKLIEYLQEMGEVCAMTGDGVNDAIALKRADIGIAMGTGTDVAKGASDMVLADDNFSTIVKAVEEGRAIYNNMKQFIRYLISSNIGEVVCIFLTASVGMPEALIPVQLLWVNLVTDGLPATALSFNPPEDDIMRRPPRGHSEPIVTQWLLFRYTVIGAYIGFGTVAGYAWWYMYNPEGPMISWHALTNFHACVSSPTFDCAMFHTELRPATISLSVLVTIEMFNALNSLSENQSIFSLPPWKNMLLIYAVCLSFALHFIILYIPVLASMFSVAPLNLKEWTAVVAISFPVIILDELLKLCSRMLMPDTESKPSDPKKRR